MMVRPDARASGAAGLMLALLCCASTGSAAYQTNDFVPLARRGQFHGTRTHWHDTLGRHCPRFGVDRIVSLPVPKPVGWQNGSDYKISFSVAKERFLTGWLPIMGPGMVEPPVISVFFTYSGDTIHSVTAQLYPLPEGFKEENKEFVQAYMDKDSWPKNVLVHYMWEEEVDVDVNMGLLFLIASGLLFSAAAALSSLGSYSKKLSSFVKDVIADTTGPTGAGAKTN